MVTIHSGFGVMMNELVHSFIVVQLTRLNGL